jgi:hypothetical protein
VPKSYDARRPLAAPRDLCACMCVHVYVCVCICVRAHRMYIQHTRRSVCAIRCIRDDDKVDNFAIPGLSVTFKVMGFSKGKIANGGKEEREKSESFRGRTRRENVGC